MATRSTESNAAKLKSQGINAIQLALRPTLDSSKLESLRGINVAVVLLPPGVRKGVGEQFLEKISNLLSGLKKLNISRIIFSSSTSVYPAGNRLVDETDTFPPDTATGRILLDAENRIIQEPGIEEVIVRFAGLCGPGREPGRLLAGKTNIGGGHNPVNLIHQQDAVDLLIFLICHWPWGQIFNACAPLHPNKSDLYPSAAKKLGLVPPEFIQKDIPYKKVNGDKICRDFGFVYRLPDPCTW